MCCAHVEGLLKMERRGRKGCGEGEEEEEGEEESGEEGEERRLEEEERVHLELDSVFHLYQITNVLS